MQSVAFSSTIVAELFNLSKIVIELVRIDGEMSIIEQVCDPCFRANGSSITQAGEDDRMSTGLIVIGGEKCPSLQEMEQNGKFCQ